MFLQKKKCLMLLPGQGLQRPFSKPDFRKLPNHQKLEE
jgi:hypothetical protein